MVQGTGNEEAWSIAQGGFGIAATLDEGWFGNGEQNNEKEIKTKTKTKKVKNKKQTQTQTKCRDLHDQFF